MMGVRDFVTSYWRIILLVVFVSVALVALFIPGGIFPDDTPDDDQQTIDYPTIGNASDENGSFDTGENGSVDDTTGNTTAESGSSGWTNLVYGLSLDGGTRISAPVVGMSAEGLDIDIEPDETGDFDTELYQELGVEASDTYVRYDSGNDDYSAEVFTDDVSRSEFAAALQALGVDVTEDDISDSVTQETRDEMMGTIETKINEAGLAGGRVSQSTMGGEEYIVTEVPGRTPSQVRTLLSQRGVVEVYAHYPGEDGQHVNETVLEQDDFENIDPATYTSETGHHVPVSIRSDVAPDFQQRMNDLGFTSEGAGNCDIKNPETGEITFGQGEPNYCLLTVVDGQVVDAHSMGDNTLANSMRQGTWENDPTFVMSAQSQQDAQSLSVNMRAGALRAPLDFENDDVYSIQPALANQFKQYSLFIGVLSVITVSGVVYVRYTDPRVAVPMIVTALSEVVVLLGFAAGAEMAIGLPEVAGFIAVVGTGVDDLVIIADEVMSEGDVNSRRVFQSRFRKAFWVIGAAAGTTIIAMSPLAVLDLGDLQGFAIITILGVLVGVLITRPAYGDILRTLLTRE